jgi:hypothetical protein
VAGPCRAYAALTAWAKMSAAEHTDSPSVRIEIQNRGGSSIAVSAINIWTQWRGDGKLGLFFNIQRNAGTKKRRPPGVEGVLPPLTPEGRHSHCWIMNRNFWMNF